MTLTTESSVAQCVATARAAAPAWAAQTLAARLSIIARFRKELFRRRAEVAAIVSKETGKPIPESLIAEVAVVLDGARFLMKQAPHVLALSKRRTGTLALWRKQITVHHEPFGVVAVISPWNYPLLLTAMHVLPALVAGNTVLLKPSEFTTATADMLHKLLQQAGLPDGVFHVMHGDGSTGTLLVNSNVDKVFFTGSERTGRRIAEACAPRFVPVSLELGGSDAAIVLSDADVAFSASGITWGRFTNAGQTCVAAKRAIVASSVYDEFLLHVKHAVESLHIGVALAPETDVGRIITPQQAHTLAEQVEDAIAKGARIVARRDPPAPSNNASTVYAPLLVLANVTPDMRVWNEETFGPVLAVVRATDDDDALRQANATSFGLSGSVWSRNRTRARSVAMRLNTGSVTINDSVIAAGVPEVPHGGVKQSGIGRVHGREGLLECVRTKTIIDDRLTGARQPWWYGYGPHSAERIDGYLRLTHGASWGERLSGLAGTLRMLLRPERPV
jgi:acyl-CoA reductase-like NAD-dependent aldehyde dehydrogenase